MRTLLVGCEYAGTTTLAQAICRWAKEAMGDDMGFHDHFKVPNLIGHMTADSEQLYFTDEELEQVRGFSPRLKEHFQRFQMEYHLSAAFYGDSHHNLVGFHIDEAVYAPLYYGYSLEEDGYAKSRSRQGRLTESHIMEVAPDTVLVLMKASPEVIARRMREDPHREGLLQEKDIEHVLGAFEEEYDRSFILRRFVLDPSTATLDETLAAHGTPEIFNTDQGSQFTSFAFTGRLQAAGIRISMDGPGKRSAA